MDFLWLFLFFQVVLVAQSCPTLCDPTDCSPPGSSVHGILQARMLEWVAIPFSRILLWTSLLELLLLHATYFRILCFIVICLKAFLDILFDFFIEKRRNWLFNNMFFMMHVFMFFLAFFFQLISKFILLWSEKQCFIWFQLLKIYWDLFYDLKHDLSWGIIFLYL